MSADLSRRNFLRHAGTGVSAAWLTAHWPAILAASTHAHNAAKSAAPAKLEFFTPAQAAEIDAMCARIIPSDSTPGAHEAGVVYFIDRALATFASDDQKTYRDGLPALQAKVRELFPSVERFSAATPEQQDQVLRSFDESGQAGRRGLRGRAAGASFFETARVHTITGFLVDPDTRGNPEGVGWKLIGHEREHMFKSPFGFYDANYPGWQPDSTASKITAAKKTSA